MQEHGRWLGLPEYLGAVSCVGTILAFRGYAHEADLWYERGRNRMETAAAVPGNPLGAAGFHVQGDPASPFCTGAQYRRRGAELGRQNHTTRQCLVPRVRHGQLE